MIENSPGTNPTKGPEIFEIDWGEKFLDTGGDREVALAGILKELDLLGPQYGYSAFLASRAEDALEHGTSSFDRDGTPSSEVFVCETQKRDGEVFFEERNATDNIFDYCNQYEVNCSVAIAVFRFDCMEEIRDTGSRFRVMEGALAGVLRLNGY